MNVISFFNTSDQPIVLRVDGIVGVEKIDDERARIYTLTSEVEVSESYESILIRLTGEEPGE